jgi:hypothetical protein
MEPVRRLEANAFDEEQYKKYYCDMMRKQHKKQ